jgi:hypothetical protein
MTCYKNIGYGPTLTVDGNGTITSDPSVNVTIPATGKSKLTIVPVLAEDNVQISHYHYELRFESLIYSANQILVDMELEIKRIKTILTTPGLRLNISPVGLGALPVINGIGGIPDLTGGPFCDALEITPIASNNAILISGIFRFDISHCSPYIAKDLVQYTSGIEYQVDEEGNISFTVETMFQSRVPILDTTIIKTLGAEISRTAGKVFVGFKRKTKLAFTRDQRIARIRTELTEIPSDAAFAPLTKHIDFTDDMESTLADQGEFGVGGFYKWQRSMLCTITLPQRVNKIWAWYVFRNLFLHRLKGTKAFIKAPAGLDVVPTTGQAAEQAEDNKKKSWYLLTKFKISNPLFSRTISFEVEYLYTMTLSGVLNGSANIFATVRHNMVNNVDGAVPVIDILDPNVTENKQLSLEWEYWNSWEDKSLTGIYDFLDTGPIVYAQCAIGSENTIPTKMGIRSTKDSFGEQDPTPGSENKLKETTGLYKEATKSWLSYSNKFEIIQSNNNEQVDYVQTVAAATYQAQETESPTAASVGFQLNSETSGNGDGYALPSTVTFGSTTNKVRMKGYAIRVGYKIPCPAVISVGGQPVSRIGESRYEHQTLAVSSVLGPALDGTNDETTNMPVYLAMWDVTYAVNTNVRYEDILSQIKSSGNPGIYT